MWNTRSWRSIPTSKKEEEVTPLVRACIELGLTLMAFG